MKVTFFVESVVGYVDNPTAIYTRGLAHGLSLRGNDVRIVEERQNDAVTRTLLAAGSGVARHFHDTFRMFQHHTYEPRSGAQLLEWVTRELSLIDVAVAVAGIDSELCRWLANVSREGLVSTYLTFEPENLTDEVVAALDLDRFDLILAPRQPAAVNSVACHRAWRGGTGPYSVDARIGPTAVGRRRRPDSCGRGV